jgi:benzylsuccinate CoA-transferase BbsE subunit
MENRKETLLGELKVLDLTDEKASLCSKLFADMGARVIKIERPGGDVSRDAGPFIGNEPHREKSLSFYHNNTGKLGITLNIDHVKGKKIFYELLKTNDVIIENFAQGFLNKLNINCGNLKNINPKLIIASVTGFGQAGHRRDYKTCDLVASAYGGQMFVTGASKPLKHYGEQAYLTASLFAAVGVLLAIRKQRKTGSGEHIDISIQEAVTSTLEHVLVRFFYENKIAKRQGPLHWNNLFHILACKDGFIQTTLFYKWDTLVEWLNSEGMAEDLIDNRFKDESFRLKHIDHIINVIGKWAKTHTKNELFELGQLMQFPWAPVNSPREVVESPQLNEREFFQELCQTGNSIFKKCLRAPVILNPSRSNPIKHAPSIGEHNIQIYNEEMGISIKELNELSSLGVI